MQRFENLEVAQRYRVQHQVVGALIKREARQMRHVAAQMLREVVQHPARRADGRGAILQTKAVQCRNLEMIAQRELRRFRSENPVVVAIENPAR